ncbi:MAG: hypothetical protein Wins2KO_11550 [Winogradskyella sp.]
MFSEKFIISSKSERYANRMYEDRQTNIIPKEKLSRILGFINCHKNGIPNNRIGYAKTLFSLFTMVNQ